MMSLTQQTLMTEMTLTKKSVDNQENTVSAVEYNRDDSNTVGKTTLDVVHFFFESLAMTYSPFFVGVAYIFWFFLVMVSSMNECWKWG